MITLQVPAGINVGRKTVCVVSGGRKDVILCFSVGGGRKMYADVRQATAPGDKSNAQIVSRVNVVEHVEGGLCVARRRECHEYRIGFKWGYCMTG